MALNPLMLPGRLPFLVSSSRWNKNGFIDCAPDRDDDMKPFRSSVLLLRNGLLLGEVGTYLGVAGIFDSLCLAFMLVLEL